MNKSPLLSIMASTLKGNVASFNVTMTVTSFYSRVERGEKVASLETIIRIANYYELSLDFLFKDSLKVRLPDELMIDIAQIFVDKTPAQSERLVAWLKMLSDNINRLD